MYVNSPQGLSCIHVTADSHAGTEISPCWDRIVLLQTGKGRLDNVWVSSTDMGGLCVHVWERCWQVRYVKVCRYVCVQFSLCVGGYTCTCVPVCMRVCLYINMCVCFPVTGSILWCHNAIWNFLWLMQNASSHARGWSDPFCRTRWHIIDYISRKSNAFS